MRKDVGGGAERGRQLLVPSGDELEAALGGTGWGQGSGEELELWDPGHACSDPLLTLPAPQVCPGLPFLLGSLVHPPGIHVHHRIWLPGE